MIPYNVGDLLKEVKALNVWKSRVLDRWQPGKTSQKSSIAKAIRHPCYKRVFKWYTCENRESFHLGFVQILI